MTVAAENRVGWKNDPPLLEMRSISKFFPGVKALDEVSLHVHAGEVLAIVGENGAGKSTLMKILAGVQLPDSGELRIDGQPVHFRQVESSLNAGIALIHQELNLADNLTVAENLYLGREPHRWGWVNRQQELSSARKYLQQVGLDVPPSTPVHQLPIGQQQLVEIAKALSIHARLLIMDEPTSSLSQTEANNLLQVIQSLSAQGVSILYISHRLREIEEIAHRVTVLRDGKNAGELLPGNISHQTMVPLMVGRDVSRFYERHPHPPGDEVLRIENMQTTQYPRQAVSFSIRKGEIVGLAGLVGAGRSELLRALFGVDRPLQGTVFLAGKPLVSADPRAAIQAGLALVPEDRKQQGLILEMSVEQNVSLVAIAAHSRVVGLIDRRYERELGRSSIEKLHIRTPTATQRVGLLSGGNQQKVVIAKWLALNPLVLLLDEPTRGIDIGAKAEIYQLIDQLAGQGVAILFASSEMEEIIGMSDRVLVMREGRLTGQLTRSELTEEAIMQLATATERVHGS